MCFRNFYSAIDFSLFFPANPANVPTPPVKIAPPVALPTEKLLRLFCINSTFILRHLGQ
ncbi:conserved hypothetical protein [Enterococcus phage phiFL1C]|uniref:Uncharacterized protein gp73 n=1 Tax=Enterococcus phage phiFL1C TaxID=673834 RepID=D2IZB9_9CAUD|nr:conserved hypothetical protein [Enterococcus phage phiFL1C]